MVDSPNGEGVPFIKGESIGETYLTALGLIANKKVPYPYLMLHISRPVINASAKKLPESLDVDDWSEIINSGQLLEVFRNSDLAKSCGRGGSLGKDWINDRIFELLHPEGHYHKRLQKFGQLKRVIERLKVRNRKGERMHGGCTNALVCQVFCPDDDLEIACRPRPRAKGISCLTELDFKPKRNRLNLFSVFRSQYFDTKAYGNLISLAMLLCKMCNETGYSPGTLTSTANNITFDVKKSKKAQTRFYQHLLSGVSS